MHYLKTGFVFSCIALPLMFVLSCKSKTQELAEDKVLDPVTMDDRVAENISQLIETAVEKREKLDDSTALTMPDVVKAFYAGRRFKPAWSSSEKWLPVAESLFRFIAEAEYEGLFPEDYHAARLKFLKDTLDADSITRMYPIHWTTADILLTDGFMHIIKDLKQGRLQPDSLSLNRDTLLIESFFVKTLNDFLLKHDLKGLARSLQPVHNNYWELKKGIKGFVDTMNRTVYTPVVYPFKRGNIADSLQFIVALKNRLIEEGFMDSIAGLPDSAILHQALRKYQKHNGLTVDGLYGKQVVSAMNNSDVEKFKRLAITLDKYKQLPEKMPEQYIWVNIPGYYLWVIKNDTIVLESKVIVGKPETRTPLLTSQISDMITYPTWTVPNSIIVNQYLPRLKTNPNYISKIGLKLLNSKGEVIDPNTVNWSKYSRGIPYKVMQGSGDNNSLGVIKFNFSNPYSVYLHDTNQRYLFKNKSRDLSHGCVRVQEWDKLAFYIANNDSLMSAAKDSLKYTSDSIKNWISRKERRRVVVKNQVKLFIRYFTCDGKDGHIRFYDDIYGEDRQLIKKYFSKK